jgi:hypothetical protein
MDFDNTYADYLDGKAIGELEALEKETGKRIMAFYSPPASATLTGEQLAKLQKLEKKLCVRLVAYETH